MPPALRLPRVGGLLVAPLLMLTLYACASGPSAQTAAPTTSSAARPLGLEPGARVLVFGDSYTEGYGAEPKTQGWAYKVGGPLQWDVTVDGVGGSGYLATGTRDEGSYRTRLQAAAAGPFDLVIVQGGSNDQGLPADELRPAVSRTIDALHVKYPGARLIMMGPVALYGGLPTEREAVNALLRGYARDQNLIFIDPMGEAWFARGEGKTMANPDNGHPNAAGYDRIADLFVRNVQRL